VELLELSYIDWVARTITRDRDRSSGAAIQALTRSGA
jgi:hypothetical protein